MPQNQFQDLFKFTPLSLIFVQCFKIKKYQKQLQALKMSNQSKSHLNIAILGHVGSGKSTLAGHLLYLTHQVTEQHMTKISTQTQQMGKISFKYAWIVDKLNISREIGSTVDISNRMVQTRNHNVTLIDTPGLLKYMKNLIVGLAQATAIILVVACNHLQYGNEIGDNGQTEEYARAAYCLGIKRVIVCINKIDLPGYDETSFGKAVIFWTGILKKVGFREQSLVFTPISAFQGANLVQKSQYTPWYKGQTLLTQITNLPAQTITRDKQFRVGMYKAFKIGGVGCVVQGKAYSGEMQSQYVTLMPGNINTRICSIQMNNNSRKSILTGDNIAANLVAMVIKNFKRGQVLYKYSYKPRPVLVYFTAEIQLFTIPNSINNGFQPIIHVHTANVACKFRKILAVIDRESGTQIQSHPISVSSNNRILVEMQPIKPIVLETYSECPAMGRFLVRNQRKIIGVGKVKHIHYIGE